LVGHGLGRSQGMISQTLHLALAAPRITFSSKPHIVVNHRTAIPVADRAVVAWISGNLSV
jgi:hypothetical protein